MGEPSPQPDRVAELEAEVARLQAEITQERARLDLITEFPSMWRVTSLKDAKKPVKYRMYRADRDGCWGSWHAEPRAAIDAALAASKGE